MASLAVMNEIAILSLASQVPMIESSISEYSYIQPNQIAGCVLKKSLVACMILILQGAFINTHQHVS